jgi:hypothetical protein
LVVAGYSGRDDSILDALEDALKEPGAFPSGLFWLHRGEGAPLQRVANLLARAKTVGVEAAIVRMQNFDEMARDLLRLLDGVDVKALEAFAAERRRRTGAPDPSGRLGWPTVRLNALPVLRAPRNVERLYARSAVTKRQVAPSRRPAWTSSWLASGPAF